MNNFLPPEYNGDALLERESFEGLPSKEWYAKMEAQAAREGDFTAEMHYGYMRTQYEHLTEGN